MKSQRFDRTRETVLSEVSKTERVGKSPLELMKQGGVAHRVRSKEGRAADSMLAVYKNRLTYTFILDREVASIHYDRERQEIFFKGHNINNMELKPEEIAALEGLKPILENDERGREFFEDYEATLGRLLADK